LPDPSTAARKAGIVTTKKKKDDEATAPEQAQDQATGENTAAATTDDAALNREAARDEASAKTDIATPTPGRIVNYTNEEGDSYPAMVSAVDGGKLHLTVFDAVMGPRLNCVDVATYGDDRGAWRWPARA
jgi:hypothetical protein